MNRHIHFALLAAALLAAAPAFAADATYSDCVRDAGLDLWASYDNAFSQKIMAEVFKGAGIDARRLPFAPDGSFDSGAEVICSAFRTPELLEKYDFPLQPLGRMHYALYTTADRAMTMMSTRVTDWPRLRVGYSPVSQGQNQDREDYFKRANLAPAYVEFPTSAEAVESLRTNALDALFLYTPLGRRPEGLVEIVPMGERNIYFSTSTTSAKSTPGAPSSWASRRPPSASASPPTATGRSAGGRSSANCSLAVATADSRIFLSQ